MSEAKVAPDWTEAGRKLFAGPCEFIFAAARADGLPPIGAPEIAFAGRSNVGKSSLINALTGRTTLARTSRTPGRTQELIFFDLNGKARLVDMPGYGYAAVAKSKSASWSELARDYLRGRPSLARVFVLVDGRHGLKESDHETMRALDAAAVSYAVVLTKGDEVKAADRDARIAATLEGLRKHVAAYPEVLMTSARAGDGVADLRAHIARLIAERGGPLRTRTELSLRGAQRRSNPENVGLRPLDCFASLAMTRLRPSNLSRLSFAANDRKPGHPPRGGPVAPSRRNGRPSASPSSGGCW